MMRRQTSKAGILLGLVVVTAVLFVGGYKFKTAQHQGPANSILVIAPYRSAGTWVFDDPARGLKAEAFVSGIPEMIDRLVSDAGIDTAESGFRLLFSRDPFPDHSVMLEWRRREAGGNWYYCKAYDAEGWLCPALFKYFSSAPARIYAKVEPMAR